MILDPDSYRAHSCKKDYNYEDDDNGKVVDHTVHTDTGKHIVVVAMAMTKMVALT